MIPSLFGIEERVPNKAIIKGPSFIESSRAFHSNNQLGYYMPKNFRNTVMKTHENSSIAILIDF